MANASSQTEAKEQGLESNESDSDDEQNSASTLLSSARAYSNGDSQTPQDSDEETPQETIDFLALQDSGPLQYSNGLEQLQEVVANSI